MKIISFSLWGHDPKKYSGGAAPNMELAQQWYPGWQLRVYCEPHYAKLMSGLGYQIILRRTTRGPWEGLFWRFDPIMDPAVEVFISRDLDSRLNPRESAAVREWLAGDKLAHVMRDHREHDVPILGGMWGCRHNAELAGIFLERLNRWTAWDRRGVDQDFLAQCIWPRLEGRVLVHDSIPNHQGWPGIHPFPPHEPMDPKIYGTEVGGLVLPP